MADPRFGITLRGVDEEARPAFAADLSTIGIIGPAPGALNSVFPLNTPVLVNSNQLSKLAQLGEGGYLADAVRGINDQLTTTQFAARLVIVRTAEGTNEDPDVRLMETINNIVGSSTQGTGIHAFLRSAQILGFTPRLIIAPGYTGQMADGVGEITKVSDGAGYVEDAIYTLTLTGGGPNVVAGTAHAVGQPDGSLGPAILDSPGFWYDNPPTVVAEAPGKHVTAAAVVAGHGGTGFAVADTLSMGNGVILTVSTISGGGGTGPITAVTVGDDGFIHGTPPTNPVVPLATSGTGVLTNVQFNLTWANLTSLATYTAAVSLGANPVCASITPVLNQLMGHAVMESSGVSQQDDTDWREKFQSDRIIPISGGVRVLDPVSAQVVVRPLASRVVGIGVAVDHEKGAPFHSWANRPIQGIIGPLRDIPFQLTDDANEAQELLGFNLGVVVRGEIGDDFAIASGGFVFIGTDNAGEDELWRFYNQKRGRDFILLTMLRALRFFLGRYNITKHTVQAVTNTMGGILRDLKADDHILGWRINFNTSGNSVEELRAGHLTISFKAEEPAPLRLLTIEHARYRDAVDALISELATQLNLAG
jgi:phage tail sheath protein FI